MKSSWDPLQYLIEGIIALNTEVVNVTPLNTMVMRITLESDCYERYIILADLVMIDYGVLLNSIGRERR